ncbi:hypothetical protein FNV43_RR03640 [Rhamnella rubrinervis]|uniref:U3 small nucleolar RNA-associated protein 6 homolog n=1 Tax=Rhamnella rubrinervis TaxID=2594499 RepID=A0A8K0MNV7_9ROSA|nr:hypothetical protein FNV43_RR03640 [Rhamnella rubrinervis]
MADVVQYRLERMVDELDDLERRGLFTRREIAEIVKQRRKFEYRLKRPSPLKQDYLAYIEYETQLDSLRRLRKKLVAREPKKEGINAKKNKKKKSDADFACVLRIVEIFRLAVMRYKGDIDLWFRYLEFCRERNNGKMKKVLAQAIRFHPKVPGIWIYAAAWEFDHNLNVAAARALMQNGLRMCPTSENLWIEYLRMELTYLNKLKARKIALGDDEGTLTDDWRTVDEKEWRDENADLFMSLNNERENTDTSNIESEEPEKKIDLFREQGLSILRTIYAGAVENIPSSLVLRKRFLEILEATDLAHSEEMREEILGEMKRDFSTEPEYWDWLARIECDPENVKDMSEELMLSQIQKALQVYEEALRVLPSAVIYGLYARFLLDVIASQKGESKSLGLSSQCATSVSHLLMVYEKAATTGCITEDLACQHISFYLQLGRVEEARKLAEKLCRERFPDAVKLWELRCSVEIRHVTRDFPSPSKADLLPIYELIKDALNRVSASEAESLWLMSIIDIKLTLESGNALLYLLRSNFCKSKIYFDKLVDISIVSLTKDGGSDNGFSSPLPLNCIQLESNLASIGDKDGLVNARKLYDSALASDSQNASLWQDFYKMETKMGTSETATAVYWRTRKVLKDAAVLLTPDS